jgi:hypothetical protein
MKKTGVNSTGNASNISFHQKSTGLSLVVIGGAAIYYFANMWPMRPIALANDAIPTGYGNLVLSTLTLIILTQIVLQTVLAIGAGSTSVAATHQKAAMHKASRNAYAVLTLGIFVAIGSVFLEELTPFCTANLVILGFLAAEIVKFASQLFYTR